MILDTDIIIDFLRDNKETIRKIQEISKEDIKLSTTSINTFELFRGAFRSKQEDAMDSLLGLLSTLEIKYFDFKASEKAAEIIEKLRANGEIIDTSDLMIASIAITNNQKLLTRNTKHFERIRELKLEEM